MKHVEISSEGSSAQTHLPRTISPAAPAVVAPAAPAAAPAAATAPPAAPSGLLQVNRPVVLLGKAAEASTSVPASGRLQTRLNVRVCLFWIGALDPQLLTVGLPMVIGMEHGRKLRRREPRKQRVWEPQSCRPAATTLTLTTSPSRSGESVYSLG